MSLKYSVTPERWALREPFTIARETMLEVPLVLLTITDDSGRTGCAEAAGVDYDGETQDSIASAIECTMADVSVDTTGDDLARLLEPGGARNAIDCALWDLRAKRRGAPVWKLAGLAEPQPVETAFTIGLGSSADVRRKAAAAARHHLLKLKVDATSHIDLVRAVRDVAPHVRLIVDANEGWSMATLERVSPLLAAEGVELIEQPLAPGADAVLASFASPVPLCADESCTYRSSLEQVRGLYQAVNIKLDKAGGLTEALHLARAARGAGLDVMVGNMCGTSLGMAPALLVAQFARWVDLDGPLLQTRDRDTPMRFENGMAYPADPGLWG